MKVNSKCLNCDRNVVSYNPLRKFCSIKCRCDYQIKYNEIHNTIIKICNHCNNSFKVVDSINGNEREFCSRKCMYENRIKSNLIYLKCENCKCNFSVRKCASEGRKFCSNECSTKSEYKRELTRKQMLENNPMSDSNKILKIRETKLRKYGNAAYNNPEKNIKTMLARYGVKYGVNLASSNGIGISKPQRKYYELIKKDFPDAILEHYLPDVQISVDIYIPSIKKVIEVYGDYWHCNPKIFAENQYHDQLHLTAKQKWNLDSKRIELIELAGYSTEIKWECDIK